MEGLYRHILLVDEDGERRRDLAFLLKIARFDVHAVNTPLEALNWIYISQAAGQSCDLILMVGFCACRDDHKIFAAVKQISRIVPVLIVDRDPKTNKQIVWRQFTGEQPHISFHQRPHLITDIVGTVFRAAQPEDTFGGTA